MTEQHHGVRVLALVPADRQGEIRRHLAPIGVTPVFIDRAAELTYLADDRTPYHVALLPAALPDMSWWVVWGAISLLNPRPAILVYAHAANFQLWSGVLEVGGYDVIVEPFTGKELQGAVLQAAKSFDERSFNENEDE